MTTRRTFILGAGSLVAAPAIVKAENLMKVYSLPTRYATVWGVGHDLEVIEHVVWSPAEALQFAQGPLYKFREVTDVVYGFDMPSLPVPAKFQGTQQEAVLKPPAFLDNKTVVQENGVTNLVTFSEQRKWRISLRPDLDGPYGTRWVQEQIKAEQAAGVNPWA